MVWVRASAVVVWVTWLAAAFSLSCCWAAEVLFYGL